MSGIIRERSRAALWLPISTILLSAGFSLGARLGYQRGKDEAPRDFTVVMQMGLGTQGYCIAKQGPPCPMGGMLYTASACVESTDEGFTIKQKQGPFSDSDTY